MKELKNLLPETAKVLEKLSKSDFVKEFTFVGGSALAVYLAHRLSEDIDLFTWNNEINPVQLQDELQKLEFTQMRTVNLSAKQADFVVDGVKVTFFANGWDELKTGNILIGNIRIAELKTLAVMKVNTLFMRAKFRDYYDLYVLNINHFTLKQLYEMASIKMKNLSQTLFQKAIVFTEDIQDETILHLKPKYKLSIKKISTHFAKQLKQINKP